jgi:hypothetical protein
MVREGTLQEEVNRFARGLRIVIIISMVIGFGLGVYFDRSYLRWHEDGHAFGAKQG